ncbi:ATP-binding protein [Streptomyces sp. NPDC046805]|uniref:ATP-binding protein n=1 Tax=Streptomyces sp. NPDC046805 TaxID=3155134 RepID=UPI00340ED16D
MTKVVRHPEGKRRPPDAPWYTLYLRRWTSSGAGALRRRWRSFRTGREARRSLVPSLSWRSCRLNFSRVIRVYAYLGALCLLAWLALGIYYSGDPHGWFQQMQKTGWFTLVSRFLGPVLVAAFVTTLFLIYWYRRTKKPIVDKARTRPHELVPTVGTLVDRIVGRRELSRVIAQTLRDRRTRRPYLLVGGVGVGKTAVLVELTRLLAQQAAVPIPIRLRDMRADGELDFEKMARRRFEEEADQGVLAGGHIDKTWRQLRLDDKAVVLADGLEEALLDDQHRDDRDNMIRRAIDRADRQQLPLVIASRPHAPLDGTRAVIADLEPLSEEAALEYLVRSSGDVDERRVDWIVETAEVCESPIYLQIARLLQQRGLLEHVTLREEPERLETRSHDCSTLRLWLLDTYRKALEDGRIFDKVVMDREERRQTIWVVSALACLGLLKDSLEVTLDDFIEFSQAYVDEQSEGEEYRAGGQESAGPASVGERVTEQVRMGAGAAAEQDLQATSASEHRITNRRDRGTGLALSRAQYIAVWQVLRRLFGEPKWLDPMKYPNEFQTEFARFAANGQLLGLVKGYEKKVRFPHSIIQAYLGNCLLSKLDSERISDVVAPALRSPGPSRELLIALVLLSRQREAAQGVESEGSPQEAPKGPVEARSSRISELLRIQADGRQDPKFYDLYAAALEIDSINPVGDQEEIAAELARRWPEKEKEIRGDRRTIEDAKLGLVRRFGAALRQRERCRKERARFSPTETNHQPVLAYWQLFEIGTYEPSHPVRISITHQIAAGGDEAFRSMRRAFRLGSDPVLQYLRRTRRAKMKLDAQYTEWLAAQDSDPPAGPQQEEDRRRKHQELVEDFERKRTMSWRYFAMRAWLLPMFVGSVSGKYREETKERLDIWLQHIAPAARGPNPLMPRATGAGPDLPLSLENALAQGFKNAANRRKRHPDTCDEVRPLLMKQAEKMLTRSRHWYAQLTLLHALCLWELPDCVGRVPQVTEADGQRRRRTHSHAGPDGNGDTAESSRATEPVEAVARWLTMAGTAHQRPPTDGSIDHTVRLLHPFVAEAGDLVTLALETGHPERFIWIDEHGAIDNVGSTPADPERYRKHNLWIAPSVGWSVLHPRAQRLLADVLVMVNLTEHNGSPDDIEERLNRANKTTLPPCLTHDRSPLHPERSVGRADVDEIGSTCLPTCQFRLCPYPPKAGMAQTEMEELFCRQQQQLLRSGFRLRRPVLVRHTAPWVSIPIRDLHAFWEEMANRNRKNTGDDHHEL